MIKYILFVLWVFLIIFLKKINMHFFRFLAGSIGLFCFLMLAGTGIADKLLESAVAYAIWPVGRMTGMFDAYPIYSMATVFHGSEAISFFVDYECSGFIETLVYVCLLAFYPVYRWLDKVKYISLGVLYIFFSNVLRVVVICILIKMFGTNLFFFSHTVFARILFFALMVILYYHVFTRPHILKQKVGEMSYGIR